MGKDTKASHGTEVHHANDPAFAAEGVVSGVPNGDHTAPDTEIIGSLNKIESTIQTAVAWTYGG